MNLALIKAAGTRALRTFIQAIIGIGAASAVAAIGGDADAQAAIVVAVTGAAVAAGIAFLQGILAGLPETDLAEQLTIMDQERETDIGNLRETQACPPGGCHEDCDASCVTDTSTEKP